MAISIMAHNVLRLEVEMDNGFGVHIVDAFADLPQKQNAIVFGKLKVVSNDPFE